MKVYYANAFRSDIRHNISDVTTKRDSLISLSSPARHGHCSLVLPESDPAMTMNRTEAVHHLLASLQLPAHLRSSSYDQWEVAGPSDCLWPS
eukprot:scaffold16199_cov36-Cyclotella_meneghiniana.AAC.1